MRVNHTKVERRIRHIRIRERNKHGTINRRIALVSANIRLDRLSVIPPVPGRDVRQR